MTEFTDVPCTDLQVNDSYDAFESNRRQISQENDRQLWKLPDGNRFLLLSAGRRFDGMINPKPLPVITSHAKVLTI